MWSKTRKKLENLICESLKSRVKFFVTQYRKSHDDHGRVCILVDNKEIFDMSDLKYNVATWNKRIELEKNQDINIFENHHSLYWEADKIIRGEGIFDEDHFFDALIKYFNNPIEYSLNSDNMIITILGLLDRRVGKRTLKKLKEEMRTKHSIVQYFYDLRCKAEGII